VFFLATAQTRLPLLPKNTAMCQKLQVPTFLTGAQGVALLCSPP
jgi:hypothetical protein